MCGITAILYKNNVLDAPIGKHLISMLQSLRHRGSDSTGVTIYSSNNKINELIIILRITSFKYDKSVLKINLTQIIHSHGSQIKEFKFTENHIKLIITNNKNIKTLAEQIKSIDNLEIDSVGSNSQVIKDTGDAKDLDKKHNISQISGSHGIGHVRLATESIVDVTHSHPFWAYPFPDITVVHNGQLTNYRSLKRLYESKGHKFQTHNDSELIAVYLADKLTNHLSLEEALNQSLVDLDGSYTYLVSTKDGLGFAKEKWSFKPLVLMERKDIIALASEEIALRQVFPEEIDRLEPQENEVMTWKI